MDWQSLVADPVKRRQTWRGGLRREEMEQHKAGLSNNGKPNVGLSAMEWVVKQDAGGAE